MSLDASLEAWLKLSQIPGLGNQGLKRLLQIFGSPEAITHSSISELSRVVKPVVAEAISLADDLHYLSQVAIWLEDSNNRIITIDDADYPQSLLNSDDPPFLLYIKGRVDLLNKPALAIVGSRNASAQGIRNAEAFAQAVSDAGMCVISGLAHGIDAAAHKGGLKGVASSIAIVGTGLDKVYPSANLELARNLAQNGSIISEFPLGTPPLAANFPRRNRIISGMCMGCLVVEASLQSGSLITARLALEQNREVFAIPGSIHSPQSKGCHALIKQGAKLVENAKDILEEFHQFVSISSNSEYFDHPIFTHLGFESVDLDTLCQRSGLTIDALSAILLELEIEGRIATLPGGLYQRIT
jgi:DNA processing protein